MTIGIVLLNSYGAALGADTVVSNSTRDGRRFLPGADKIFNLSERAPAALMVCGDLHFADIAWGPLTRFVRRRLTDVGDFADVAPIVIRYLADDRSLSTEAKRLSWGESLQGFLTECLWRAETWWIKAERQSRTGSDVADPEFPQELLQLDKLRIEEFILVAAERILAECAERSGDPADAGTVRQVAKNNAAHVAGIIHRVFPDDVASFTAEERERLESLLAEFSVRVPTVQLVLVGYATDDAYPSAQKVRIYGMDGTQLRADTAGMYRITRFSDSHLIPVGQAEEVEAFLSGIHPDVVPSLAKQQGAPLAGLMATTARILREEAVTDEQKHLARSVIGRLSGEFGDLDRVWRNHWDRQVNKLRNDTLDGLALLPKQGLAEAADTLLSQAILRRTLTVDAEQSIGGFVEVALLSQEGGFDLLKSPRLARIPVPRNG
jgi:hypothetical protein